VLTVRDGVEICVPDSFDSITTYVLCEQGDWFEDELPFVRRLLRPGDRVVDVGANCGVYALAAAARVGPQGAVWAVEPASATADLLRASVARNGFFQVVVVPAALSDREGSGHLALRPCAELNTLVDEAGEATEAVALETLDRCANQHGWERIDLLKLDAEGQEAAILRGGAEWLRRESPLVLFEVKHQAFELDLVDRFAELGYAAYRLVPGLGLLTAFDASVPVDAYQLNLFACKPERAAALEARGLLASVGAPAPASPHLWRVALGRFGRERLDAWAGDPDVAPGWDRYQVALGDALCARDESLAPSDRLGHLRRAYDALRNVEATIPRLASLARVAADLGQRVVAVETLSTLAGLLGDDLHLDEPYLTPSSRFDALAADDDAFRVSVLERLEELAAFSNLFGGGGAGLEQLAAYGLSSPAVDRRRRVRDLRARGVKPSEGFAETPARPEI
jgi:FkbM family methyltransferase